MYHFVYLRAILVRFVGPSGSGKSTIFNLIERMYDIDNGDITYGNESIYDIPITIGVAKLDMSCSQTL